MSFSIQLTPDMAPVEPGAATPISVVIVNRSDEDDRFEMEIEGIDPEWKAVPVPVFGVDANESHEEKVFFKPPRTSESLAGNYPFVARVRSLISGEQRTMQGVLQIKPYHHLTMEIGPKKGYVSPARKQNTFDVAVVNLGNTEHTMQLVGSDPEDACAYDFEHDQVTIAPGQQREIELTVNPTSQPIFSGGKLIGFTVTGRSIDSPNIVTSAQAQLEQRSLFSPTSLIFAIVVALLFGAWLLMMPKPPSMSVSVDPPSVVRGQQITVSWTADQASRVTIKIGDALVYEGQDLKGSRTWTADKSGTVTILGTAAKDARHMESTAQVTVTDPPQVPAPVILKFSADPERIRLGESFILRYKLGESVTRAVLSPVGSELDIALNEFEITPTRPGDLEYTIVASNKDGDTTRQTVKIRVVDESDARIPVFRADPPAVQSPDTRSTLNWLVTGAVRVELNVNGQTMTINEPSGTMEIDVTAKSTYVMTAYDQKGRPVTRKVTIDYKDMPPNDTTTGMGGGTTTTPPTGVTSGTGTTSTSGGR